MVEVRMGRIDRTGQRWECKPRAVVKLYEKYLRHELEADALLSAFPGRTFKSIQEKYYRIVGRRPRREDIDQMKIPFGEIGGNE